MSVSSHAASSAASPSAINARSMDIPTIDTLLTRQLAVAWAGERGDEPRLGWWRSDLVSEFGGLDLFRRLLPNTWEWAVLEATREAARRQDAALRAQDHNPDRLRSLFSLGFELDECINKRLAELKRAKKPPKQALPDLQVPLQDPWNPTDFVAWLKTCNQGTVKTVAAPVGRRIPSTPPASPTVMVGQLLAALLPLSDNYPLPHFKRAL